MVEEDDRPTTALDAVGPLTETSELSIDAPGPHSETGDLAIDTAEPWSRSAIDMEGAPEEPHARSARIDPPGPLTETGEVMLDLPLGPGTEIGGYVIDSEIGKGGMGFVYSATHPVIGKRAAIKVLKVEVSKSPIVVERFIQEARAVNQIGHPNIIDIFAFGTLPDGRAYHVMDLLIGESLRRRLRRGPLHPSEAASVIDEMVSALIAAHDKGFVHRDLKPDNVFLVERETGWPEVKLLDFGLAKLMPEAGMSPFQTKVGVMLGTPEYMSPEQARGLGVDYRTDIYALGVVTFEILGGMRPFPSYGDSFSTLQAHVEEEPPSIASLVPELPVEMVQLVDAMLAKEPAARPSLAAVRTVIKRLRTTALPSRGTVPAAPATPARSLDPLTASRVDAIPVLPGDPAHQPPGMPPRPRTPSQPHGSQPDASRPSQPPLPASSTHGSGSGSVATTPTDGPAASAVSAPAAAPRPSQNIATKLGVPPPPKPVTRPRPPRAPRSNRVWLVLGALLAIAAGIAIALVLVGS